MAQKKFNKKEFQKAVKDNVKRLYRKTIEEATPYINSLIMIDKDSLPPLEEDEYYFDDLSLSEIAENEGGSRQGAMDVIKRAEKELLKIEDTLGLYNRNNNQTKIINELKNVLDTDLKKAKTLLSELEKTF